MLTGFHMTGVFMRVQIWIARVAGVMILTIALLAGTLVQATPVRAADVELGAVVFGKCQSCHMIGPDARNRVGPQLNELFGRSAAAIADFNYSPAMKRASADGLIWTTKKLLLYIQNPNVLVTGTRMNFRGIKDANEREDLLAYLRQFTANPSDIPESEPTAPAHDPDINPAVLAIEGDPTYGEYLSGECVTCHQISGADQGIPSIIGWPQHDFLTALHAYKNKHRPHPVMQLIARNLSDEEIAALAAYFESVE